MDSAADTLSSDLATADGLRLEQVLDGGYIEDAEIAVPNVVDPDSRRRRYPTPHSHTHADYSHFQFPVGHPALSSSSELMYALEPPPKEYDGTSSLSSIMKASGQFVPTMNSSQLKTNSNTTATRAHTHNGSAQRMDTIATADLREANVPSGSGTYDDGLDATSAPKLVIGNDARTEWRTMPAKPDDDPRAFEMVDGTSQDALSPYRWTGAPATSGALAGYDTGEINQGNEDLSYM